MVFPVVMYGCESWTVKKAEHLRIDAFSHAPPGSQASSRGEAKASALLSSRDAGLLEPPETSQQALQGGSAEEA